MTTQSRIQFGIQQWAAWAPEIETRQQWLDWSVHPYSPKGEHMPDVSAIPAIQRRRMNRLTRMVFHVVTQMEQSSAYPQVYCSRHGDLQRSTELLQQIARTEPMSSMSFGLSVHNAVAGNLSILQNNTHAMTSLAAGQEGIFCAVLEAASQSRELDHPVVLVVYDDQMPELYRRDNMYVPSACFAFALLIDAAAEYELTWANDEMTSVLGQPTDEHIDVALPNELAFLAWLLRDDSSICIQSSQQKHWRWSRLK